MNKLNLVGLEISHFESKYFKGILHLITPEVYNIYLMCGESSFQFNISSIFLWIYILFQNRQS